MPENPKIILKIHYPTWFILFYTICFLGCVYYFTRYFIWVYSNHLILNRLWQTASLSLILIIGIWFLFKVVFYSVIATNKGIENRPLVGAKKYFSWLEIIEVRRPKFKMPYDAIYIVTETNKKMMIMKGMKNLNQMIGLIKNMSPNLRKCI